MASAATRFLVTEGERFSFSTGDLNTVASAATATTESVVATTAMTPVPRWLPHGTPPQLQPFVRSALPARVLKSGLLLHLPYNCDTSPSEPRPPSPPTRLCSHPGAHPILGFHRRPPLAASAYHHNGSLRCSRSLPLRSTACAQPLVFCHTAMIRMLPPATAALNSLHPTAPAFACSLSPTTAPGAPAVLTAAPNDTPVCGIIFLG